MAGIDIKTFLELQQLKEETAAKDKLITEIRDNPKDYIKKLETCKSSMEEQHSFKPGDLVVWKPGLKNKNLPIEGVPSIVMSVLEEPVFDTKADFSSPYFQEPMNLIVGVIHLMTKDFLLYHVDGRRFQLYKN